MAITPLHESLAPIPESGGKRRWRLLQVESALACNLRCVMCPWKDFRERTKDSGVMQPEIWAAIRLHLSQVQSVDFTGGGEPLLQPKLAQWVSEAKAAGCETGVLTNGLLLVREKAEELTRAGLGWLCVSLDGATAEEYGKIRIGSNFRTVCENLGNIARVRSGTAPKTMINFVMMRSNFYQVEEIVRLAASLGVDQVNFKQCEVSRDGHGRGLGLFGSRETKETRSLRKALSRARNLARKLNVQTTASSFTPTQRAVCEQDPRDSAFISYKGVVAPCINLALAGRTTFLGQDVTLPEVHYGTLPQDDLADVWETHLCAFYRTRFDERARAYNEAFMQSLMSDSRLTPERLREAAVKRMPEAPEGCKVCHYLYDI